MSRVHRSMGWTFVTVISTVTVGVLLDAFGISCQQTSPAPAPTVTQNPPAPSVATPTVRLRIATSKNVWCALTLIANKQKFFREEGLEAEIAYQAAGRLNMDALIGGAADVANVVETNIAYQALTRASDLAIHGTIVIARDYTVLTKRTARIKSSAKLRGRRLSYAQATGAESFVFWYLEHENLPRSALKLVPLQPAGVIDHFLGTETEAVATWEPFASAIRDRLKDVDVLFQGDPGSFAGIMTIATRRSWSDAHPAAVKSYGAAMARAARLISEDPTAAQTIVSQETGIPVDTVRSIWERFDFRYRQSSPDDVKLVHDVIGRIVQNVPAMEGHEEPDVSMYFPALSMQDQ